MASIVRASTLLCLVKHLQSLALRSGATIGSEQSQSRHSNVPCILARSSLPPWRKFFRNKDPFERGLLGDELG
jgi:hypothetical protein